MPDINPGERFQYYINNRNSLVAGYYIMIPDPKRDHSDQAWNRIDRPKADAMNNLERNGFKGKRVRIVFLQIWERERDAIILPLQTLEELPNFRRTGDFTVKKVAGSYALTAPRWEDEEKFKLNIGPEKVFQFL